MIAWVTAEALDAISQSKKCQSVCPSLLVRQLARPNELRSIYRSRKDNDITKGSDLKRHHFISRVIRGVYLTQTKDALKSSSASFSNHGGDIRTAVTIALVLDHFYDATDRICIFT